jgi:histidinol phosphatase-like enzyme
MLLSRYKNAQQNHNINIANRAFENVTQFEYFVMIVTNQNLIQEKIKKKSNFGNACYHSNQIFCLLVFCPKT